MTGIKVLLLLALLANNGFVASASHLQHGHSGKGRTEEPVGSAASAIVEADRRLMSGLEMCYEKFKPDALLSNHRPGKWVTQIWQKDRMFGNLSRDSILLNLPTIPVYDFLDPNQMKSYIIYKDPGNWGPLTIIIKPQQFAKVSVAFILNDSVDLSDAVKQTTHNGGEQVYSYSTFCAPPGQYRIILQARDAQEPIHVELVHKYEQMQQNWPHLDQVRPVKIRCRSRKQNKQMLIKWDKCNVDGNQMQYCLVINNQRNMKTFCEAIADKLGNGPSSCNKFDFLHDAFSANKRTRNLNAKRLDSNGTSIFCSGTRSQQLFRRFKPNMNYYIDVFGVHPNLSQFTFHLGSNRMWYSNKNFTIPLLEGRPGQGKLSQLNDLITFSYKPLDSNAQDILLYIVPCGGTVMIRIVRQKRVLLELRHIHKPILHKMNMTRFAKVEGAGRLMIKVFPNSVDEAFSNIKVEITARTLAPGRSQMMTYPRNLSLAYLPSMESCNSVDILWHPVPRNRVVRYCILSMIASTSSYENVGLCGIDEKILQHARFHQLYCLYSKFKSPIMERMKLLDLSPKSSYMVYVTASLTGKETIKYEPLRIQPERHCHFFKDEFKSHRELANDTSSKNNFYDLKQVN